MNNLKVGIIPNFTREKSLDITKNTIAELEKLNIDYYFDINSKNDFILSVNEKYFIDNIQQTVVDLHILPLLGIWYLGKNNFDECCPMATFVAVGR